MKSFAARDVRLLFATRIARMLAYGALSLVLVLYLTQLGLDQGHIGALLTLTLLGDALDSLLMTSRADRYGRRLLLAAGAGLMVLAGVVFAATREFIVLVVAAVVGIISPSGYEVGPFQAIEQAFLSQIIAAPARTAVFAWYNLAGSLATLRTSLPVMPTLPWAIAALLARFSISQMDVPTRQSYTMAVVNPEERSAAAGVLGVTRSTAAAISPSLAAPLYGSATLLNAPFLITGLVKIAYDLALYKGFRDLKPPEEES